MIINKYSVGDKILKLLELSKIPLSAYDMQEKIKANKTSIYRQIDKLVSKNLIIQVDFSDGILRYERADCKHHHHLICIKCGKIQDVVLKEPFVVEENKIKTKTGYKILRHSLEFFGLCPDCKTV